MPESESSALPLFPDGGEIVVEEARSLSRSVCRFVPERASVEDVLDALRGAREESVREWRAERFRLAQAALIFAYWAAVLVKHDRCLLDAKRERYLVNRLTENHGDADELLYVVDGAKQDDNIMGRRRDSYRAYDGISTIFRDREQVERLAGLCQGYRNHQPHRMTVKYHVLRLPPA